MVTELVNRVLADLRDMQQSGLISAFCVERSDRSEAVYITAYTAPAPMLPEPKFTIRIAGHPVTAPGPQYLLGNHPGADSADAQDAVRHLREWATMMYRARTKP